ncbi:MAG TPA: AmmeMemoRadiSam system radical SAM enzyme, partial [Clostridiales bacterium]|nr:AmmeMemoRadiSam system radical SAM enzyme [Clostridiales bacterium]
MDDLHQALHWLPLDEGQVRCELCPHKCRIAPGRSGICRARKNIGGCLVAWSYGKITSLSLDPIEKKPLFRFHPGSRILSAGSFGCNFRCSFCQNWTLSQQEAEWRQIQPDELAALARKTVPQGNIGAAFTYNEPLVSYEYVLDCSRLIRQAGLQNVLVTNGFINPDPLEELLPWIDALNIDLKSWDPDFYRRICGGEIEAVKATIARCARTCHVEITTLLIPGLNDAEKDIQALAAWLASIDRTIPLHLTRYHPDYKMKEPVPIGLARMQQLADLARRDLRDVFLGNV